MSKTSYSFKHLLLTAALSLFVLPLQSMDTQIKVDTKENTMPSPSSQIQSTAPHVTARPTMVEADTNWDLDTFYTPGNATTTQPIQQSLGTETGNAPHIDNKQPANQQIPQADLKAQADNGAGVGLNATPTAPQTTVTVDQERSVAERADNKLDADNKQASAEQKRQRARDPFLDCTPLPQQIATSIIAQQGSSDEFKSLMNSIQNTHLREEDKDKIWFLVGEPGTGKTTFGKAIAQHFNMPFFSYFTNGIGSEYQTSAIRNLEDIFVKAAQLNRPCVIILDEMEKLFDLHTNDKHDSSGMLNRLNTLLDKYRSLPIFFFGTMNDASKAPKQFISRFKDTIITMPLPTQQQRVAIIQSQINLRANFTFPEGIATTLAAKTDKYTPRDLENLVRRAVLIGAVRISNNTTITAEDLAESFKRGHKNNEPSKPSKTWKFAKRASAFAIPIVYGAYNIYQHREQAKEQRRQHEATLASQRQMHDDNLREQRNARNRRNIAENAAIGATVYATFEGLKRLTTSPQAKIFFSNLMKRN